MTSATGNDTLAMAAHDVRQPLFCIRGYAEMLLDGALGRPDLLEEGLRRIVASTLQAERIMADVSDEIQVEGGTLRLRREDIPLAELVAGAAAAFEWVCCRRGVELSLEAPDGAGTVWADRARLERVLSNLVTNALQHMPERGGWIRARVVPDRRRAVVEVTDNGRGFDPALAERLFERHYSDPQSSSDSGQGLGLYVARLIVRAHGGAIWARSAGQGRGATFGFSIPRLEPIPFPALEGKVPEGSLPERSDARPSPEMPVEPSEGGPAAGSLSEPDGGEAPEGMLPAPSFIS